MGKPVKKVLKGVGISFGVLILLLSSAVFYLKTGHALRLVQERVNALIPGSVFIDALDFSLLRGKLDIQRLVLKNSSEEDLAGFDRLQINISWLPLLMGELRVAACDVESPWTKLAVDEAGHINLMDAIVHPDSRSGKSEHKKTVKKGRPLPVNVVVNAFRISRGSVHFEMVHKNVAAELSDIHLTAQGNLFKQSAKFTLIVTSGWIDSPKLTTLFKPFSVNAGLNGARVELEGVKAGTDFFDLSLSGRIDHIYARPFFDLVLDMTASLSGIQKSFKLTSDFSGQARGHLTLSGLLDNPSVALALDYGGGVIAGTRIDAIDFDMGLKDRKIVFEKNS